MPILLAAVLLALSPSQADAADPANCFGPPDPPLFAQGETPTAPRALEVARSSLRAGNLVRAMDAIQQGLAAGPQDPDLNLFGAALLHAVDPQAADAMQKTANVTLPPFPTIPPAAPAKPGKAAWVNVASAGLRATPSEQGEMLGRLPIGTQVKVAKPSGDFLRVNVKRPGLKAKSGFVHKDLLSSKRPTIASILAEADQVKASGPDYEATMLWRAINLDPRRADVRQRILDVALTSRRYGLALDAVNAATRAGAWPLDAAQEKFPTGEDLRLHLYRAAVTRNAQAIRTLLAPFKKTVMVTNYDAKEITLTEYYERALSGGEGASELWKFIEHSALVGTRSPEEYVAAHLGMLHLASDCSGWVLSKDFEAPGGYSPDECVNGCNESEGNPEEGESED